LSTCWSRGCCQWHAWPNNVFTSFCVKILDECSFANFFRSKCLQEWLAWHSGKATRQVWALSDNDEVMSSSKGFLKEADNHQEVAHPLLFLVQLCAQTIHACQLLKKSIMPFLVLTNHQLCKVSMTVLKNRCSFCPDHMLCWVRWPHPTPKFPPWPVSAWLALAAATLQTWEKLEQWNEASKGPICWAPKKRSTWQHSDLPSSAVPMEPSISARLRAHPLGRHNTPKDDVLSLTIGQWRTNWGQSTARVCMWRPKVPTRVSSQTNNCLHVAPSRTPLSLSSSSLPAHHETSSCKLSCRTPPWCFHESAHRIQIGHASNPCQSAIVPKVDCGRRTIQSAAFELLTFVSPQAPHQVSTTITSHQWLTWLFHRWQLKFCQNSQLPSHRMFLQAERAIIVTTCPRNVHDDFKMEFDWHKRTR